MLKNCVQTAPSFSLHFRWPLVASCLLHLAIIAVVIFTKPSPSIFSNAESIVTFIPFEKAEVNQFSKASRRQVVKAEKAVLPAAPTKSPVVSESLNQNQESASSTGLTTTATQTLVVGSGSANRLRPIDDYLSGLRQLIEQRKIYPAMAKRMGEVGRVLITLSVLQDGTVQNIFIKEKSLHSRLNQAAFETVSKIKKYHPIPASVAETSLLVEVPIEFSL